MARAKKIGKVKRSKNSLVWVDKNGNVWEKPISSRKRKQSKKWK